MFCFNVRTLFSLHHLYYCGRNCVRICIHFQSNGARITNLNAPNRLFYLLCVHGKSCQLLKLLYFSRSLLYDKCFTELANTKYIFKNTALPLRKVLYLHTFVHMHVSIETLIYDDVSYKQCFWIFCSFSLLRFRLFVVCVSGGLTKYIRSVKSEIVYITALVSCMLVISATQFFSCFFIVIFLFLLFLILFQFLFFFIMVFACSFCL